MDVVLCFETDQSQARDLATALDIPCQVIQRHTFPDGESRLTLPPALPPSVVLYQTLAHPDPRLTWLLLAAGGCRMAGVTQLALVAPYLCYMRQDKAFHPGEVVSQRIIGSFLDSQVDALLTVDPHLHRVHALSEVVPHIPAVALTAAGEIGRFLAGLDRELLLAGPDAESEQWVAQVARVAGCEYVVGEKQRHSDTDVEIRFPSRDFRERHVVLVDDVASSGRTLAVAAREIRGLGARRVDAVVTHPLFADDALAVMQAAGIQSVWSTDSIPHPSNTIPLAGLLARALRETGGISG